MGEVSGRRVAFRRSLAVVLTVALAVALSACSGNGTPKPAPTSDPPRLSWSADSGVVQGASSAKITVDTYEDPRCDFCTGFEFVAGPDLQRLVNDGTIRLRRHLTASLDSTGPRGDDYSLRAGNALLCAADQHDALSFNFFYAGVFGLDDTTHKVVRPVPHERGRTDAELIELATDDAVTSDAAFQHCVSTREHAAAIRTGTAKARTLKLDPTHVGLFIDGHRVATEHLTEKQLLARITAGR